MVVKKDVMILMPFKAQTTIVKEIKNDVKIISIRTYKYKYKYKCKYKYKYKYKYRLG